MAFELERRAIKRDSTCNVTVVHLTGGTMSRDDGSPQSLHTQLLALADESNESHLLLDFGNVEYVSCAALGALLRLRKALVAKGGHMAVGNLSPNNYEVFVASRLHTLFDLRLSAEDRDVQAVGQCGFPNGVLAVDDETAVLGVLAARLRGAGFSVWPAGHGHQAVELYLRHRHEIAVVMLDVRMPGMDGPHTLTALQKISPTVRCCFMTGNPAPYTEQALLRMGALRVFEKPFAFAEVIAVLNRLAWRSSQRRQNQCIESHGKGA